MAEVHSDFNINVNRNGIEVNSNGVPYYKFPPYPDPPAGVTIIPFTEFKPSGIQIPLDDDIEVDGLGIPTVRLAVTHDNEAPPRKKKKIKRNAEGEEIRQSSIWWEEASNSAYFLQSGSKWEAGEAQRIQSANIYDPMFHPKVRIERAVEEFKRVHDWQTPSLRLLEWYSKFLYFLGLDEVRPKFRRKKDEEQQEDDGYSDDEVPSTAQEPAMPRPVKIENFDEQKHQFRERPTFQPDERFLENWERKKNYKEQRLEAFIENPHHATMIFFSSYFRHCGMMWETMALRDAPRLVEFFLNYLYQTRALNEEEASVKLALQVAKKAKEELPLTMKVGVQMPDELARCLTRTYGSRTKQLTWQNEQQEEVQAEDLGEQFKAEVEQGDGFILSNAPECHSTLAPQVEETTNGWTGTGADAPEGWGANLPEDIEDNPWAKPKNSYDWALPDESSLMTLLGPTTLPLTHTVGYVEESTRYVESVTLPDSSDKLADKDAPTSSDLLRNFARVVLKPYPASQVAAPSAPRHAIQPPELIEDPWAGISSDNTDPKMEKPTIPRHDPTKDSITLLIDPKVGKDLASCKKMGLGGTFVQVVPNYSSTSGVNGQTPDSEASIGRPRKAACKDELTFWYAEKIMQIIPSYWTEKTI